MTAPLRDAIPFQTIKFPRQRPSPLSPPFKFLFQPCPWVIYADPHCLNILNHPKTDSNGQSVSIQSSYANWTNIRIWPVHCVVTAQAIYRFQEQHGRPFSRASTCFRQSTIDESTQSTVNSCAIRIDSNRFGSSCCFCTFARWNGNLVFEIIWARFEQRPIMA